MVHAGKHFFRARPTEVRRCRQLGALPKRDRRFRTTRGIGQRRLISGVAAEIRGHIGTARGSAPRISVNNWQIGRRSRPAELSSRAGSVVDDAKGSLSRHIPYGFRSVRHRAHYPRVRLGRLHLNANLLNLRMESGRPPKRPRWRQVSRYTRPGKRPRSSSRPSRKSFWESSMFLCATWRAIVASQAYPISDGRFPQCLPVVAENTNKQKRTSVLGNDIRRLDTA
jgi:hypothetical protein